MSADTDDGPTASPLRADARRNREQILRAAREVFTDQGPDAPLDEIARRAGVGIATLYRRFPRRDDLHRGVAVEVLTALIGAANRAAAEEDDACLALRRFLHTALDLKIGSVLPSLLGRFTADDVLDGMPGDAVDPVDALLVRAQAQGRIRPDVVFGDITLMIIRLSRPLPGGGRFAADDALAHRQLDVYLDGLRPTGSPRPTTPLGGPAVDVEAFKRLRERLIDDAYGARADADDVSHDDSRADARDVSRDDSGADVRVADVRADDG
ncbi:TetR/AcrR family transcriptional regulator [Streptomyces hygroscopicus]|uniref:TetR/AcrR family transcriptional regulator n=1 Tax=Streptomyces hygroscopicus TaxID=1912 RepID=UPI000AEF3ED7|nr:TetR/AcrR family transcriptional regulator [Streptomyces hygroscopicus]GLV77558.1 TetR family transcriptional regulator [Streptomyces hygroscopicus subsp. hygroscopicus]